MLLSAQNVSKSFGSFLAVRGADPDIFLLMWDLTSKDKLLNTMRATMKVDAA